MEAYDLVEVEDFGLNHYIHHFGEELGDAYIDYSDVELDVVETASESDEEIYWA